MKRKGIKQENNFKYLNRVKSLFENYAVLQLVFSYYTFCEDKYEKEFLYSEDEKKKIQELEDIMSEFILHFSEEKCKGWQEEILALRSRNEDEIATVTEYIAQVQLYKHVLNHMQYKFITFDDDKVRLDELAGDLYNDIFLERDNALINQNIKYMLEEFPAPIVKAKFYDYIRQNIHLYVGKEKWTLDRRIEHICSVACLKELKDSESSHLPERIRELEQLDYRSMDKDTFENTKEFVRALLEQLKKEVDSISGYQTVLNNIAILLILAADMSKHSEEYKILKLLIESRENHGKLAEAEAYFQALEGKQEQMAEDIDFANVRLEELRQEGEESELLDRLFLTRKLIESNFAKLEESLDCGEVTEDMAARESEKLIAQFKQFFKIHNRVINQSVIAKSLAALPRVYSTREEVERHITYAISQRHSKAQILANLELYHLVKQEN